MFGRKTHCDTCELKDEQIRTTNGTCIAHWQMWSMKFHMCRMYKGYDSIMDGTLTVPTIDKLLKEQDDAAVKAGQMMIKLKLDMWI